MSWTGRSLASSAAALLLLAGCGSPSKSPTVNASSQRSISVTSPAFSDGGRLPSEYTCAGEGHAPELRWTGVPSRASSISVVVDDPDAPGGTFTHWVVTDLDAHTTTLARDAHPAHATAWKPPCPPAGNAHHYRFTVYAKDARGDTIAYGRVVALYSR